MSRPPALHALLLNHLQCPPQQRDGTVIDRYVNAILAGGTLHDAQALLDYFLSNSLSSATTAMLPVFERLGQPHFAKKIYERHVIENDENIRAYPELLETLGKLQFQKAKPLLIHYAFDHDTGDYHTQKYAALGLLHLNCTDIRPLIRKEIERTLGENLFPEFIPALVCKLDDCSTLLQQLWDSGSYYCSTDCNAGIILGFSLCGDEGRAYFKRVLTDSRWEADSSATGSAYYTYLGTLNIGLSLKNIFHTLSGMKTGDKQRYGLYVLLEMLQFRINDYTHDCPDTIIDLYRSLFHWNLETDLAALADGYDRKTEAYTIRDQLELKITEEALISLKGETP